MHTSDYVLYIHTETTLDIKLIEVELEVMYAMWKPTYMEFDMIEICQKCRLYC